jgi:basic membrane protein A
MEALMTSFSPGSRSINRRTLVIGSAAAAALAPMLRVGSLAAQSDLAVTGVTDTAGLGDQNFNDLANKGGETAAEQYGVSWRVLESQTAADYIPNLTRAAQESDLTVAIGFLLTDAVAEIAAQFPDDKFMLIDSVVESDNVASVLFKEQEGAFLAGIAAGLLADPVEKKIGFVGGIRIPPVMRYEVGFRAGVMTVAPDVEVLISYADDFENPTLGKELTLAQYDQGANIVLAAAGRSGVGAFDAAKEKGEGVWVIGADADQSHLGPEFQLCAVAKRIDEAVVRVVGQAVEGAFEGGVQNLGIADEGVGLFAYHDSVGDDVRNTVQAYADAIAGGEIVPPVDDDTFEAFEPIVLDAGAAPASPAATPAS